MPALFMEQKLLPILRTSVWVLENMATGPLTQGPHSVPEQRASCPLPQSCTQTELLAKQGQHFYVQDHLSPSWAGLFPPSP